MSLEALSEDVGLQELPPYAPVLSRPLPSSASSELPYTFHPDDLMYYKFMSEAECKGRDGDCEYKAPTGGAPSWFQDGKGSAGLKANFKSFRSWRNDASNIGIDLSPPLNESAYPGAPNCATDLVTSFKDSGRRKSGKPMANSIFDQLCSAGCFGSIAAMNGKITGLKIWVSVFIPVEGSPATFECSSEELTKRNATQGGFSTWMVAKIHHIEDSDTIGRFLVLSDVHFEDMVDLPFRVCDTLVASTWCVRVPDETSGVWLDAFAPPVCWSVSTVPVHKAYAQREKTGWKPVPPTAFAYRLKDDSCSVGAHRKKLEDLLEGNVHAARESARKLKNNASVAAAADSTKPPVVPAPPIPGQEEEKEANQPVCSYKQNNRGLCVLDSRAVAKLVTCVLCTTTPPNSLHYMCQTSNTWYIENNAAFQAAMDKAGIDMTTAHVCVDCLDGIKVEVTGSPVPNGSETDSESENRRISNDSTLSSKSPEKAEVSEEQQQEEQQLLKDSEEQAPEGEDTPMHDVPNLEEPTAGASSASSTTVPLADSSSASSATVPAQAAAAASVPTDPAAASAASAALAAAAAPPAAAAAPPAAAAAPPAAAAAPPA
eukprot:CAMPEP_0181299952 /NCGR_PEP_ID=MMETSP1101-20121128/6625_1 /TAXON_ID=46948 /ORGANISM="Rhodomonas abbreviata, Strain Caron Lab Isolate" /LENGTH=599 /DNA_ID=CAMNT_0023405145 /DNA_START=69 /DNA_END=1864 /DNA_ORIENTATION=-